MQAVHMNTAVPRNGPPLRRFSVVNASMVDFVTAQGLICAPGKGHSADIGRKREIENGIDSSLQRSGEIIESRVQFGRAEMKVVITEPERRVQIHQLAGEDDQTLNQNSQLVSQLTVGVGAPKRPGAQLHQLHYRHEVQHEDAPHAD